MNRKRLLTIIESYGADPARWPAAEREAAAQELCRQPDAGALLTREGGVDAALSRLKAETSGMEPPPDFLMQLRTVPQTRRQRGGWVEAPDWLRAWPQLSSLAAAMMLAGFVVGSVLPTDEQPIVEIEMGLALYGTSTNSEIDS